MTKGNVLRMSVGVAAVLLTAPWLAAAQGRDPEAQKRRNHVRIMEGVLVQAVRLGAEEVSKELARFEPTGVTVLSGMPRARGFVLDGHGIFFDVEIPDMNQSVVWSVMVVQRERQMGNAVETLRTALKGLPEGSSSQQAQAALAAVEKSVAPFPPKVPNTPAPGQLPDPNVLYTETVKEKLVEVMLDHSLQMNLGPDEWLTVAARDSEGPLSPAGLSDAITITLRVKGSDLSIYQSDPTRRNEIREKVKSDARVF